MQEGEGTREERIRKEGITMFYRWREQDFITIPAYKLKQGDEIAYGYGGNRTYGAVLIETVVRVQGLNTIMIQYKLPVGAIAESSEKTRIAITWQKGQPLIQMSQDITFHAPVFIRRR